MKNSKRCTKCQSENIARVVGKTGAHGVGNNILYGTILLTAINVTRYLCVDCGFAEEWVESRDDLEIIKSEFM